MARRFAFALLALLLYATAEPASVTVGQSMVPLYGLSVGRTLVRLLSTYRRPVGPKPNFSPARKGWVRGKERRAP
jgi:hypothetical protein